MVTDQQTLAAIASRINEGLTRYSDKDWNYSRIILHKKMLSLFDGQYALWVEFVSTDTKQGDRDLKTFSAEIAWGDRHSNELGILEIISLRLNKALCESTNDDFWNHKRPFIRLIEKEKLILQGFTEALWYEVQEVKGEEFDNR
jgi:hypothetical protein